MRLRFNSQAKEILKNSHFLITKFPMQLKENTILELGMGKGQMLIKLAQKNPDKLFIGYEKNATIAAKAARQTQKYSLKNFFIINNFIEKLPSLIQGKINIIWLTFPDPWPKKKHFKRRLTNSEFLLLYKKILTKNGVIKFKTDNDKLFLWTIKHLKENNILFKNMTRSLHHSKYNKNNIMTNYEKKWTLKGKNINYLEIYYD